jgi:hypothetical protein
MTQDEIIELVQEAGIVQFNDGFIDITKAELDKFANLVSAKEREACAKLCDELHYEVDVYGAQCAAAIRARRRTHD